MRGPYLHVIDSRESRFDTGPMRTICQEVHG